MPSTTEFPKGCRSMIFIKYTSVLTAVLRMATVFGSVRDKFAVCGGLFEIPGHGIAMRSVRFRYGEMCVPARICISDRFKNLRIVGLIPRMRMSVVCCGHRRKRCCLL